MSRHNRIFCLLFSIQTILFLTSCSNQPYFVIENNSQDTIKIELVYDSLNIEELVTVDIFSKKPYELQDVYSPGMKNVYSPVMDSIIKTIPTLQDPESIIKYLYDSLSIYSLRVNDFGIANLNKVPPYSNSRGEH